MKVIVKAIIILFKVLNILFQINLNKKVIKNYLREKNPLFPQKSLLYKVNKILMIYSIKILKIHKICNKFKKYLNNYNKNSKIKIII